MNRFRSKNFSKAHSPVRKVDLTDSSNLQKTDFRKSESVQPGRPRRSVHGNQTSQLLSCLYMRTKGTGAPLKLQVTRDAPASFASGSAERLSSAVDFSSAPKSPTSNRLMRKKKRDAERELPVLNSLERKGSLGALKKNGE